MSKHDFDYYKESKYILKHLPTVLKLLEKFEKEMYPYREWVDIKPLLYEIINAKNMVDTRIFVAKKIIEKKGKIDE